MDFGTQWPFDLIDMSECPHTHIMLLSQTVEDRLRCRHCHLTIRADELAGGCCPECLAESGHRRSDFETVASEEKDAVRYRCEDCGSMLNPVTT